MKIKAISKAVLYLAFSLFISWIHLNGQSWTPQGIGLLPLGYKIWSISAVNDSVIWVTASHVTINPILPHDHLIIVLLSVDGGNTWKTHYVNESLGRMSFDIKGIDAKTAWLTTQGFSNERGRAIYKTDDGGMTWQNKLLAHVGGVFIQVIDKDHIYCQNNRLKAWSMDGGENWKLKEVEGYDVDQQFNLVISGSNMSSAYGDTIWVGTTKGNIVRTINYGEKSEILNTGIPARITSISFKDSKKGMLYFNYDSCCTSGIARTFDGGTSWQLTPSKFETFGYYNITCIPGKEDIFIATPVSYAMSEYFWTCDFGESWISGGTINNAYTNCIDFCSTSAGWVATDIILSEYDPLLYKWNGEPFSASNKAAIATIGPVPNHQFMIDPFIYSNPKFNFSSNSSVSKIPTAQSIINTFRYRKRYELLYGTNLVRFYSKAVEEKSGIVKYNFSLLAKEKRELMRHWKNG